MELSRLLLTALAALFIAPALSPDPAAAQEAASPGVVVVTEYRCGFDHLADMTAYFDKEAAPVLDGLVEDGSLTGWGMMHHMWGDDFNFVVYFLAESRDAFFAAHDEYFDAIDFEEALDTTGGWCDAHRDNIYSHVRSTTAGG